MIKKASITILVLLIILTLASMTALGKRGGPGGGDPPEETPPADVPDTGTLYGDLYVILRDVNGVPLDENLEIYNPEVEGSCIQPIAASWEEEFICDLDPDDEFVDCGAVNYGTDDEPDWRKWVDVYYEYQGIKIYDDRITEGEPFSPVYYVDEAAEIEFECELSASDAGDPEDPEDDVTFFDLSMFVQAVDFGRLNLGRAPDAVINHAFDEAINKFNNACDMRLDPAGRIMYALTSIDSEPCQNVDWFTIDSPAENIALYIKMLTDGHWITTDTAATVHIGGKGNGSIGDNGPPEGDGPSTEDRPVLNVNAKNLIKAINPLYENLVPDSAPIDGEGNPISTADQLGTEDLLLAASLLAGGAGKSGNITMDLVIYINAIYGITWQYDENMIPIDSPFPMYQYGAEGSNTGRSRTYGSVDGRSSLECETQRGAMWVLKITGSTDIGGTTYESSCLPILTTETSDYRTVRYTDFVEVYRTIGDTDVIYTFDANIRGFAQAADDALQTLEYIHNYRVPEDIYADSYVGE